MCMDAEIGRSPSLYLNIVIVTLNTMNVGTDMQYEYLDGPQKTVLENANATYVITRLNAPGCLPEFHRRHANLS